VDDPRPTPEAPSRPERRAPRFVDLGAGRARLRVAVQWQTAALEMGLDDADRLVRLIDALVPDSSRRAGRAATRVVETGCGPLFLKRALKGGALAPLFAGRIPRFARALHELDATARLGARGAPVLEPVLVAGVRDRFGWRAVVGTVFQPGTRDGASALAALREHSEPTVLQGSAPSETARVHPHVVGADRLRAADAHPMTAEELARRMGRAIRAFHDAGGAHADLAITNLLVDPATGEVRIVDLQGAGVGAPPTASRRRLELRRLRRSIERRAEIRPLLARIWPVLEAACVGGTGYGEAEPRAAAGVGGDDAAADGSDGVTPDAAPLIDPRAAPIDPRAAPMDPRAAPVVRPR